MQSSLPQSPQIQATPLRPKDSPHMAELKAWRKCLRADFPLPKGTRVYLHIVENVNFEGTDSFAKYRWVGNRVDIWLRYNADESRMVEDLWHEWAHLCCPGGRQDTEHAEPFFKIEKQIKQFYWHGKVPKKWHS